MNWRNLYGSTLMILVGFAAMAAGGPAAAEDKGDHHAHFAKCAKVCADCQLQCDMCFAHCRSLLAQGQ